MTQARCHLVAVTVALTATLSTSCSPRPRTAGGASPDDTRWVAAWEAAPQLTEPRNMPPAPGLTGTTLRQRVRVSLGGDEWRFRVSNEFGDAPLTIGAVRVGRVVARDTVDSASSMAVLFAGSASVTVAPGVSVLSDPVRLTSAPLSDLGVSIHVTSAPPALTGHPGSRTTSFVLAGEHVAARMFTGAVLVEHWYLLSGIEVRAPSDRAAVVVLGNSIADGRGSGTDQNNRWPDNLARRFRADARTAHVAVLNAGIGGNAVLHGGLGPTALARLDRDVLSQAGARWLIVSEGVNDIGGAADAAASAATATGLIAAYRDIIRRGRARGFRVYGATILPFGGSFYASAEHEAARRTVNDWIRASAEFDAVIDFDVAMRDSSDPTRLQAAVDGGDHLHPNEHGYRLMADAIDLALFASPRR
jgi:lysophospholipase L1-like esterase